VIALLQRVTEACVQVKSQTIARIGPGLLVLVCAQREDTSQQARLLLQKLITYRVFADDAGKMNRSLLDTGASLLLVPQFTLAADTRSGTRPSFTPSAPALVAKQLFDEFVGLAKQKVADVQTGQFGADMQVALVNNGPVTFWLET
jgi:D-aminoacyl-tRNA deacylase